MLPQVPLHSVMTERRRRGRGGASPFSRLARKLFLLRRISFCFQMDDARVAGPDGEK